MKGANECLLGSTPTLPDGKVQNSSSEGVYCGQETVPFEVGIMTDF